LKKLNNLHIFVFCQVIFNLIDIPQLINHSWIPVNDTSNTILTKNLLSTLDIVEKNITNLTNLGIRTPFSRNYHKPTVLHVNINPKFLNTFGINKKKDFSLFNFLLIISFQRFQFTLNIYSSNNLSFT